MLKRLSVRTAVGDMVGEANVESLGASCLILVPGLGNDRTLYADLLKALARLDRPAVAVDLLGFGESRADPAGVPYTFDLQAHALAAFCEAQTIVSPHLVLHSMSIGLATSPAFLPPSALTLLEGNLIPEDAKWSQEIVALGAGESFDRYVAQLRRHGGRVISGGLFTKLAPETLERAGACYERMDPRAFRETAAENVEVTLSGADRDAVARIVTHGIPVRYVRGGRSASWNGEALLADIGVSYEVLEGAGHYPMLDAPEALAAVIVN